jgi:alkylation response protein AidB-like acyl-CoA dehydrogenase
VPAPLQSWYGAWNSPYYNDSHRAFRAKVRQFTETEIMPFCHEWDEAKTLPKSLFEKASAAGWLPVCVGAWPTVRLLRLLVFVMVPQPAR